MLVSQEGSQLSLARVRLVNYLNPAGPNRLQITSRQQADYVARRFPSGSL